VRYVALPRYRARSAIARDSSLEPLTLQGMTEERYAPPSAISLPALTEISASREITREIRGRQVRLVLRGLWIIIEINFHTSR